MEALSEAEHICPEDCSTLEEEECVISAVNGCGRLQRHQQRRRTVFTEQQLEYLKHLFRKNPYPDPSLKKQLACRMNMHPTVLQVWFKNQRAKLKKANNHAHHILKKPPPLPPLGKLAKVETETQTETEREAETEAKAKATERRSPPDAYPVALVYTGHALPSYQLTICPDHLHPGGHKLVHFGCCQDPLVYCMHPVPRAQGAPAPALPSLAPHGHREATQPSGGQGPLQAHTGDCPAAEAPLDSGAGEP